MQSRCTLFMIFFSLEFYQQCLAFTKLSNKELLVHLSPEFDVLLFFLSFCYCYSFIQLVSFLVFYALIYHLCYVLTVINFIYLKWTFDRPDFYLNIFFIFYFYFILAGLSIVPICSHKCLYLFILAGFSRKCSVSNTQTPRESERIHLGVELIHRHTQSNCLINSVDLTRRKR